MGRHYVLILAHRRPGWASGPDVILMYNSHGTATWRIEKRRTLMLGQHGGVGVGGSVVAGPAKGRRVRRAWRVEEIQVGSQVVGGRIGPGFRRCGGGCWRAERIQAVVEGRKGTCRQKMTDLKANTFIFGLSY